MGGEDVEWACGYLPRWFEVTLQGFAPGRRIGPDVHLSSGSQAPSSPAAGQRTFSLPQATDVQMSVPMKFSAESMANLPTISSWTPPPIPTQAAIPVVSCARLPVRRGVRDGTPLSTKHISID